MANHHPAGLWRAGCNIPVFPVVATVTCTDVGVPVRVTVAGLMMAGQTVFAQRLLTTGSVGSRTRVGDSHTRYSGRRSHVVGLGWDRLPRWHRRDDGRCHDNISDSRRAQIVLIRGRNRNHVCAGVAYVCCAEVPEEGELPSPS